MIWKIIEDINLIHPIFGYIIRFILFYIAIEKCYNMISLIVLLLFSYVSSQTVPFYDTAKSIYVSGNTVLMTSDVTDYTVNFPTGFTISTFSYRKPFIAVHST